MTQLAWVLLALAAALAVVDWVGVWHGDRRLRWVGKPGAILLLVGVALALNTAREEERAIFIGALFLSLVGDLLLLPEGGGYFLAGLAAFLGAHLAYIDGFLIGGVDGRLLPYSGAAVAIVSLAVGGRIVGGLATSNRAAMIGPVVIYALAISGMVALAGASGKTLAAAGAVLFYLSDGLIAWNRFRRPLAWTPLPVIVTYHLGQALLVLSLAT